MRRTALTIVLSVAFGMLLQAYLFGPRIVRADGPVYIQEAIGTGSRMSVTGAQIVGFSCVSDPSHDQPECIIASR